MAFETELAVVERDSQILKMNDPRVSIVVFCVFFEIEPLPREKYVFTSFRFPQGFTLQSEVMLQREVFLEE